MSDKKLVEALLIDDIKRSISQLGIERTLEAIDYIARPKQRAMLRLVYFKVLNKEV